MLSVRFWGVRGSIPCPGPDTVKYGGNTTCLEIRAGKRLIVIDMGTGVKALGDYLIANDLKNGPLDLDIFISHTHWDHIMGFPMFGPLFVPGTKIKIRGPVSYNGDTLASVIGDQLSYKYWPVRHSELAAKIEYHELKETTLDMGEGLKVTAKYMNHPLLCLGYRFEYEGKSIVTAFDHEPYRNLFPTNPEDPSFNEEAAMEGAQTARDENQKILNFLSGADLLIHDSHYTPEEYKKHLGWGHSSYEHAYETACGAKVKKIAFFHHDPNNNDQTLASMEKYYKDETGKTRQLEIITAREGLVLEAGL